MTHTMFSFNSLPNDKSLDLSKLKDFADTPPPKKKKKKKKNQRTEGPESRTDGETLIFWD